MNTVINKNMFRKDLWEAIKDMFIKYKKMIFGVDTSISIKCLIELRKQEVIDERIYRIKFLKQRVRKLLCKNLVLHGNNMIGIL